jgi:putative transposase
MPDWPHAPAHRLDGAGAYMVTAGTYRKEPFFRSPARLTLLCNELLHLAADHGWKLQAWAVFPNHYHFISTTDKNAHTLRTLISHLHTVTAKEINSQDHAAGRRVWFQYWDSHLTYPRSYLARLHYVHGNAVYHRLVRQSAQYAWCSAGWFQREADRSFFETVMRFPSERIKVLDDFTVDSEHIR